MATKQFSAPVNEVKHDRYGRYLLRHPHGDPRTAVVQGWTRATTLAKTLDDNFGLDGYHQRMVAKGIALRPSLLALASATPLEDKDSFRSLCNDAQDAAGAGDKAQIGTALHGFCEVYDETGDNTAPAPWDKDVDAYGAMLRKHGVTIMGDFTERVVFNEAAEVAGRVDRIVEWTDPSTGVRGLYVADIKTGTDLKYSWQAIAVQLALYAYAGYVYDLPGAQWERLPLDINKDHALVLHVPQGMGESHLYRVPIRESWDTAVPLAKAVREWRKTKIGQEIIPDSSAEAPKTRKSVKAVSKPAPAAPAEESSPVAEQPTVGATMLAIGEAESVSELKALYANVKLSGGVWTKRMSALVKARMAELNN